MLKKLSDKVSAEFAIDIFIALMVGIYPLVFHDSYYDILPVKYQFYSVNMITLLFIIIILSACQGKLRLKKLLQIKLSFSDNAVILFWICCVISTFQSDYFYESFWEQKDVIMGCF